MTAAVRPFTRKIARGDEFEIGMGGARLFRFGLFTRESEFLLLTYEMPVVTSLNNNQLRTRVGIGYAE